MKKRHFLMLTVAALATAHTHAQLPAPAQPAVPDTWQEKQKAQAWATAQLAATPRRHAWVEIPLGGRMLKAYVTWPDGKRRAPAVLVLHEAFGLTDSTRAMADTIAAMGYVTIAPDMLSALAPDGGDSAAFPTSRMAADALVLMSDTAIDSMINAWSDYAARLPDTDGRMVVGGLSWGGGAAFRYAASALQRRNLKAVFIFYDVGPPAVTQGPGKYAKSNPPLSVERIGVPVYGFYPDRDTRAMSSLPATREAMQAAGKVFDAAIYPGAEHAYMRLAGDPADANPVNAASAKASYARLQAVLESL